LATKTLAVSCSAQEPSPTRSYLHLADAIAFVSCDPVGSGAATLAAYEFRDEDQVERAMGDFVQAIPVPSGPCDGGMGNTIWSSRDTRPGGLILCAIEVSSRGGTPYVVWSEPATHRLFYVTGPTGASNGLNDLEVWWSTWVRPQQAKRTDDEHRLLATIGRRLDTDHCRRDPLGGAPNAIASMVCAPVRRRDGSRTGASYAFFERFASPQALAGYFAAVVRAEAHGARDEPSRGCDTVGVEIDSWSARGRRLCWSVNGDARIGWTTDADLTYGELRRGDGNRFALFATWSQAAE
jgi:hypothetical protein